MEILIEDPTTILSASISFLGYYKSMTLNLIFVEYGDKLLPNPTLDKVVYAKRLLGSYSIQISGWVLYSVIFSEWGCSHIWRSWSNSFSKFCCLNIQIDPSHSCLACIDASDFSGYFPNDVLMFFVTVIL